MKKLAHAHRCTPRHPHKQTITDEDSAFQMKTLKAVDLFCKMETNLSQVFLKIRKI